MLGVYDDLDAFSGNAVTISLGGDFPGDLVGYSEGIAVGVTNPDVVVGVSAQISLGAGLAPLLQLGMQTCNTNLYQMN